jgi:hypothetical protein
MATSMSSSNRGRMTRRTWKLGGYSADRTRNHQLKGKYVGDGVARKAVAVDGDILHQLNEPTKIYTSVVSTDTDECAGRQSSVRK